MVFDIDAYHQFVKLLYEHPEWRAEVRRLVLSEDILTLPDIVRELSLTVKELAEAQKRTETQVQLLGQRVDELAEAQKRTETQVQLLGQRVDELAEAQKRTETQVQLLGQRVDELAEAQKRTETQVQLLGQRVDELAEAQNRTETQVQLLGQRVDALAEAQKRTETQVQLLGQRVDELAEAQKRTETQVQLLGQRVDELAEAQKRTEQRVDELAVELRKTRSEVAGLAAAFGSTLEEETASVVEAVMRRKGYRLLADALTLRLNGDVDVILPVETAEGRRLSVVVESKARLGRKEVTAWTQRIHSKGWQKRMATAGYPGPYLAYVYAIRADVGARDAAAEAGIGLLKSDGEIIPPAGTIGG